MAEEPLVYVNGTFVGPGEPALSAQDRGFTLADGVFETMVAASQRIFRLEEHLERLQGSGRILGLTIPPEGELISALRETWRQSGLERAVLRLTVTRGSDAGRGVPFRRGLPPTVVVRAAPLPRYEAITQGVSLHICSFPRNERSPVAAAKTLAYAEGVAAWLEAERAGADDALLLNTQGNVACATTSNVFGVWGDEVATPALDQGVLPGIARRAVLALAVSLGMRVSERSVTPEALLEADEAFLTNVVRGPMPIGSVSGRSIGPGTTGRTAERLAEAYWRLVETEA